MKINSLLESQTPSSSTVNTTNSSPEFGRDDKLEETTTSGSVATVASPVGGMQRRSKGSMLKGIKTSSKFPNSKEVKESQINEVDPRNFDSDEDYYAAKNAPAKARYHGTQSPGVNPDDEAYFREIFRKQRLAKQKQEREQDHDRLATGTNEEQLDEFAPDEGGGSRKFIPWPEFIDAVKQIVGKDFSATEKVIKSTIQDRFIPHDPMEYGPTMLYSYYEARAGRGKGAVSTRGSIQVGKYYPNNTALGKQNFITQFSLLKGHPFERHFDLTFDNIYKIANIIMGNTEGAYQMQPQTEVEEGMKDIAKSIKHAFVGDPKDGPRKTMGLHASLEQHADDMMKKVGHKFKGNYSDEEHPAKDDGNEGVPGKWHSTKGRVGEAWHEPVDYIPKAPRKRKPQVGNRVQDIRVGSPKIYYKNGKAVGEVGIDSEASPGNGSYYMKHYLSGKALIGYDTPLEASKELAHLVRQESQSVVEASDDKEPFDYAKWKASNVKPRKPRGYKDAEAIGQQQREIDKERKERKQQGVAEGTKDEWAPGEEEAYDKELAMRSAQRAAEKSAATKEYRQYGVTARKHGGDDAYSWAVFINGRVMVNGLSSREVPYYKKEALKKAKETRGVAEGLPKAQDGRYNPDGSKKKQWHQDPKWQQRDKDFENDPKNIYGGLPKKVNEKSKSQAQFRTMAAVAHNPKFAKKVGISQKVGKEFHSADKKQDYKDLPKEVEEGEVTKTSTGLKHSGDYPDYPGNKGREFSQDPDRLNKSETGRLDKAFGVKWEPKGKRKEISGDPTGVNEAEFTEDKLASDLYRDLQIFKKGIDKDIGSKAKDKEISNKAKDKDIVAKEDCWDGYEQIGMKDKGGKKVPNCVPVKEQDVSEDWQKTNKQDKTDGMSPKAVKAYRRENPGSKLKTAVTKKPSELKAGSKDANRRKSFCARMSGNKGPMKDENGKPTPKAKALKRWNC